METTVMDDSLAAQLASWTDKERDKYIDSLSPAEQRQLFYSWDFWARSTQREPEGDWLFWLLLGGRGGGKSRVLTETLVQWVKKGYTRLFACAKSKADVRDILVENGPSSILNIPSTRGMRVDYQPSKRRVVFEDYDATVTLLSGDEPRQARGPNFEAGICDELAAWQWPKRMLSNLVLATRLGPRPKIAVATTPRPISILFDLVNDPKCHVTKSTTYENERNLSPIFLREIHNRYDNTSLGQQEVMGELLSELPGALFKREDLENHTFTDLPELTKVIVGLDPSGTSHSGSDTVGIVACGVDKDGDAYIFEDYTGTFSPAQWSNKAVELYYAVGATAIVYESNYGGDMIPTVIRNIEPSVFCIPSNARRDKKTRAQNLSMKSEQGKLHIHEKLTDLIDEFLTWSPEADFSPGRLDAAVHAFSNLFKGSGKKRVRVFGGPDPYAGTGFYGALQSGTFGISRSNPVLGRR